MNKKEVKKKVEKPTKDWKEKVSVFYKKYKTTLSKLAHE